MNSYIIADYPSTTVSSKDIEKYYSKKILLLAGNKKKLSNLVDYYPDEFDMECTLQLQVEKGKRIFMHLRELEIENPPKKSQNCSPIYVEIYDDTSTSEFLVYRTCETLSSSKIIISESSNLFFRFKLKHTITTNISNHFTFLYNAFMSGKFKRSSITSSFFVS